MQLSSTQYWEWREKIEEMQHAETKLKCNQLQQALMEKDAEILKLKTALFKQVVKQAQDVSNEKKDQYNKCKEEIEKSLGISLNGKSIDETTFEIKDLEG